MTSLFHTPRAPFRHRPSTLRSGGYARPGVAAHRRFGPRLRPPGVAHAEVSERQRVRRVPRRGPRRVKKERDHRVTSRVRPETETRVRSRARARRRRVRRRVSCCFSITYYKFRKHVIFFFSTTKISNTPDTHQKGPAVSAARAGKGDGRHPPNSIIEL